MANFVSLSWLDNSLKELAAWRLLVNAQTCQHLWQFLSLKRNKVTTTGWTAHPESKDFDFCDAVLRVRSGAHPYYDPLTSSFRIASHPHSNLATARKNTFKNRWDAAETKPDDPDSWRLKASYIEVLKAHICTRAGVVTKVPLHSLAAWTYRTSSLDDFTTPTQLIERFLSAYSITADELTGLFSDRPLRQDFAIPSDPFSERVIAEAELLRLLQANLSAGAERSGDPSHDSADSFAVDQVDPQLIADMLNHGRRQIILYGPPGTGKTYLAKAAIQKLLGVGAHQLSILHLDPASSELTPEMQEKGAWCLVQFHPSYSYEDFVRGISGKVNSEGNPIFVVEDRVFVRLCLAASRTSSPIVLLIDEINRGDLAKVLGELVYALEYRMEPVTLQYQTQDGGVLRVPSNLYIIGTMNTADRSIASVDYAIRRRFDFIHCASSRAIVEVYHRAKPYARRVLALYDAVLECIVDIKHHGIGHAYFLEDDAVGIARSFVFQILPLLEDYQADGNTSRDLLRLPGWEADTLPFGTASPFALVDEVAAWLVSGDLSGPTEPLAPTG